MVNVSKKYGISQSPNKYTTDMLKNGNAITIEKTEVLQEADGFPDFEVAYEMVVEATEELPESFIEKRRKELHRILGEIEDSCTEMAYAYPTEIWENMMAHLSASLKLAKMKKK